MGFIQLNRIERKRLTVFLSCLVVSVVTWLAIALSGKYRYRADTRITYIESPENKAYHPLQDDSVSLEVEGSGWQLLFSRLRINPESIEVSLRNLNSKNYVVFSNQLSRINNQLESHQRIISVSPDTLFFDFSRRTVKKVPVRLMQDLQFEKNFGISGPIRITPSHVIVNGAIEDVRKIKVWNTVELQVNKLKNDFSSRISLANPPSNSSVDVYPATVKVEVPVDRFTEKVLEVPVKVLNARPKDVKLLPEKVKVTLYVALSNYASLDRDSVTAVVNLKDWTDRAADQLPVTFTRIPPYAKILRVEPQVLDFFVYK